MLMFLLVSAIANVTTVTSFIPPAYVICCWPRFAAYRSHRGGAFAAVRAIAAVRQDIVVLCRRNGLPLEADCDGFASQLVRSFF